MTPAGLRGSDRAVRGWLAETGLLTHRLRIETGSYTVTVETESEVTLSAEDAGLLGCEVQPALLREIELQSGMVREACIFARTLVPRSTLRSHPWLADLGGMPLGEALEQRDDVTRSGFEIARLQPGDDLYLQAARHVAARPAALWARRSMFRIGPAGLLVYEVFLPALGRYARAAAHEL